MATLKLMLEGKNGPKYRVLDRKTGTFLTA